MKHSLPAISLPCSALPSIQAVLTLSIWLKWIWRVAVCISSPPLIPCFPSSFCKVPWNLPKHTVAKLTLRMHRCSWSVPSIYMSRKMESMRDWKKKDSIITCRQAIPSLIHPFVPEQDGNISQDLTGDGEERELWEASAASSGLDWAEAELDVIYTWPTSGSSGRRRNHYLPPESCPSHVAVSVGFHIKMDPLLLQHPTSPLLPPPTGASTHSLILKVFCRLEKEKKRRGMSRRWWPEKAGHGRTGWLSLFHVKTLKVARELCCDRTIPEAAPSHSLLRWRQTH